MHSIRNEENCYIQGASMNKVLILIVSIFYSLVVQAKTVVCSGTVEQLSYHTPDKFMIQLSSMNEAVFFCNSSENWDVTGAGYITSPKACNILYSTFLAAKLSGKSITSMYFDGDGVPDSCNGWGPWSSANIRHFVFK